ncbi:hypothetical protein SAM40697_5237 [Streptomyces ambofaciens]|uniref:Integral membrane protein n=1 Tax=Streptomyces ambofaciens TaxID=1889 RepID=A0ABN4PFJ2_STRAM|nr:hypothetical protein [Streptomyces ambofaciens]ANB09193.1 hypothetical protein SAM40697_5237 [Streptomyces ambofaciens]
MTGRLKAARHLWVVLALPGTGWCLSAVPGTDWRCGSAACPLVVSALLALGLFGSASGIDLARARAGLRTLTVGVLAEAA